MPKGVTEPFMFRFIFARGMKYLHHFVSHYLKQDLPHLVRHLGIHYVEFSYVVPDVGISAYTKIGPDIAVYDVE